MLNSEMITPVDILIVEDDDDLAGLIHMHLGFQGHRVTRVNQLSKAKEAMKADSFSLMILDRGLPDGDGLLLSYELRQQGDHIPILMLTARDSEVDKVEGLESGADDYLTKPFSVLEFQARVRTILRRQELMNQRSRQNSETSSDRQLINQTPIGDVPIDEALADQSSANNGSAAHSSIEQPSVDLASIEPSSTNNASLNTKRDAANLPPSAQLQFGQLFICPEQHHVKLAERTVALTATEFSLLHFLAKRPGRVYSKDELLAHVWNTQYEGYQHTVCSTVNRLRSKLETHSKNQRFIHTVWGVGYKFQNGMD